MNFPVYALRIVDPISDPFFDERTDTAQFKERSILRDKRGRAFGPRQRIARSASESANQNARFALGLARQKFSEFSVS